MSELLLSLTIVGIIAIITVPVILNNIQKKMFATKVKNFVAEIEQLAQQELIRNRTRDLSDTDFADPEKLLSDKYFQIIKSCNTKSDALKNCWKLTATGNDKITYKTLNKSNITTSSFKSNHLSDTTIILKNGVIITCKSLSSSSSVIDEGLLGCSIDINGNDKPNIGGRDLFRFFITNKGKIVDYNYITGKTANLSAKQTKCTSNYVYCFGALVDNNWKMDY